MSFIAKTVLVLSLTVLSACVVNTSKDGGAPVVGSYSSYGNGVQFNESKGMHYVDVFVGGGGDLAGAKKYAAADISEFGRKKGFANHDIVESEYSFFPLSKYRLYVTYR